MPMAGRRVSSCGQRFRQGTAETRTSGRLRRGGGAGTSWSSGGLDESEDGKTSHVLVPDDSLVSLLVHADQRSNPLRMIHFAEVIPAPPPPPSPSFYQTPSPIMPRGDPGARRGGSGSTVPGSIPPPTQGITRSKSHMHGVGRGIGKDETGDGKAARKARSPAVSRSSSPVRCITCEISLVVRLGSPREEGEGAGGCGHGREDEMMGGDWGTLGSGGVSSSSSCGGSGTTRRTAQTQGLEADDKTEEQLKQPNVKVGVGLEGVPSFVASVHWRPVLACCSLFAAGPS